MEPPEESRFEELVIEALDGLPPELAQHFDNVAVFIEDGSPTSGLLGLYEGNPLTARDGYGDAAFVATPDSITIFRLPLAAACRDEAELVDQVRVTVVHELAHHFGIEDDRLDELGWG